MSEFDDLVRRAQELEAENRRLKVENGTYQTNLESLVQARTDQLQAAVHELETSYDITLQSLGDALDIKEASTGGHSKRVTAFTIGIARAMELPADQIAVIARGAFLHDIGKMAIRHQILLKPSALTPEEIAVMREHSYKGYQLVHKIPFLREAAEIVYAHHERYDGTGYPRGLKGQQIPLGARLVAVANTLDSITSDLPYRPARTVQAACQEIENWSGRQFDPEIVKTFLSMPDEIWSQLATDIRSQVQQ